MDIYIILYGKPSLRQILGKSLCSDWFFLGQDFAVQSDPTRVFLFCSEAGKFQICNLNSDKRLWILSFFTVKLPEEAEKIEFFSEMYRMKGGVALLSIAMRTIDFEAIFYQLCSVLN